MMLLFFGIVRSIVHALLHFILGACIFPFFNSNRVTGDHLYIVLHVMMKHTTEFERLIITKAVRCVKLFLHIDS